MDRRLACNNVARTYSTAMTTAEFLAGDREEAAVLPE